MLSFNLSGATAVLLLYAEYSLILPPLSGNDGCNHSTSDVKILKLPREGVRACCFTVWCLGLELII